VRPMQVVPGAEADETGEEARNLSSASSLERLHAPGVWGGSAGRLHAPSPSGGGGTFAPLGHKKSSAASTLTSKLTKLYNFRKPHLPGGRKKWSQPASAPASPTPASAPAHGAGAAHFYGVETDKRRQLDEVRPAAPFSRHRTDPLA